jgi:hypothetical protein
MITGKQARELAQRTFDQIINDILLAIEEEAKNGNFELQTERDYKKDRGFWSETTSREWKKARDHLSNLGFAVDFNECSFANSKSYTVIYW